MRGVCSTVLGQSTNVRRIVLEIAEIQNLLCFGIGENPVERRVAELDIGDFRAEPFDPRIRIAVAEADEGNPRFFERCSHLF